MAVTVRHATLTAVPDDPAYDVGADEWNEYHTVTNAVDKTGDTMTGQMTVAQGTITTSQPFTWTQTWNAGAVTFTGLKVNITNMASAAGSLVADFQVGGSSKFALSKSGAAIIGGVDVGATGLNVYATGGPLMMVQQYSGSDGGTIIGTASGSVTGSTYTFDGVCQCSGRAYFRSYNLSPTTGSAVFACLISATTTGDAYSLYEINGGTAWSAGLDNSDSDKFKIGPNSDLTASVGLSITTGGVVEVTSGLVTTPVTVATLPTGAAGMRSFVTDANATTFASVVAGGGANGVPVYHDGTNWRIG